MDSFGSVTHWLGDLANGSVSVAQQELFARYFSKLVSLARQRLRQAPRAAEDEEDVALSAMDSFFRRAGDGAFPHLHDRDQLWAILVTITSRKAIKSLFSANSSETMGRQPR